MKYALPLILLILCGCVADNAKAKLDSDVRLDTQATAQIGVANKSNTENAGHDINSLPMAAVALVLGIVLVMAALGAVVAYLLYKSAMNRMKMYEVLIHVPADKQETVRSIFQK